MPPLKGMALLIRMVLLARLLKRLADCLLLTLCRIFAFSMKW